VGDETWRRGCAPQALIEEVTLLKVPPDRLLRVLSVVGYPRALSADGWRRLYGVAAELRVSHFVEPIDAAQAMRDLRGHIRRLRASLLWAERSALEPSPYDRVALEDAEALQAALAEGRTRLFRHTVYIAVIAATRAALERDTAAVVSQLEAMLVVVRRCVLEQSRAWTHILPRGWAAWDAGRSMDGEASSWLLPPFDRGLLAAPEGELWGVDVDRHRLVTIDRFALLNPHAIVLATSGSGKSFFLKSLLTQVRLRGHRAAVIDPQGEYGVWAQWAGGRVVPLHPAHRQPLFCDLWGERRSPEEVQDVLFGLLETLTTGGVPATQRAALAAAVRHWAAEGGAVPSLRQWVQRLAAAGPAGQSLAATLQAALDRGLEAMDAEGGQLADGELLAFDLRYFLELVPHLLPAATYLIAEWLLRRLVDASRHPLTLALDEGHTLLRQVPGARFLEGLYRTGRKRRVGVVLATQAVGDLLGREAEPELRRAAAAVLANASTVLVLRQQHAGEVERLRELYRISALDGERLLRLPRGEGVVMAQGEAARIRIEAPPSLVSVFTAQGLVRGFDGGGVSNV